LVGVGTGHWQTSRCNTPGKNHGRVHYNDGDIIGLIKVEINEWRSKIFSSCCSNSHRWQHCIACEEIFY
jgi:hypothetical protein